MTRRASLPLDMLSLDRGSAAPMHRQLYGTLRTQILEVRVRRSRVASDAHCQRERPRLGKSKEAIFRGELEVALQGAAVERKHVQRQAGAPRHDGRLTPPW